MSVSDTPEDMALGLWPRFTLDRHPPGPGGPQTTASPSVAPSLFWAQPRPQEWMAEREHGLESHKDATRHAGTTGQACFLSAAVPTAQSRLPWIKSNHSSSQGGRNIADSITHRVGGRCSAIVDEVLCNGRRLDQNSVHEKALEVIK